MAPADPVPIIKRPEALHADRGYDFDQKVRRPRIVRRGKPHGSGLGNA